MTFTEDGVHRFPGFCSGDDLVRLQTIIGWLFQKAEIRDTAESTVARDTLEADPFFLSWLKRAFSKEWTATAIGGVLERVDYHAHRLYPWPHNHFGAYRWHFDAHPGGPVKAMLLLTDLDEQGQAMEYIAGPHVKRKFANYDETRWPDETQPPGEVVPVVGKAGTLWLFDAWNWHRGVRKMAPIRDTLTVEWLKFT